MNCPTQLHLVGKLYKIFTILSLFTGINHLL